MVGLTVELTIGRTTAGSKTVVELKFGEVVTLVVREVAGFFVGLAVLLLTVVLTVVLIVGVTVGVKAGVKAEATVGFVVDGLVDGLVDTGLASPPLEASLVF